MGKWTQGPWRWEFNPKTKTAQLCGGKPQFDSTVMDFVRVGMSCAGPRVIDQTDLGLLTGVAKFAQPSAGREHHSSWFQVLRHPDLDLIAAAPELAEALKLWARWDEMTEAELALALETTTAALAKAGAV
ncbi:MAG: hypothetical protein AELANPGJ_02060 [Anaerolineae bacterium]|nr:hypothetical protein [Anaerolineae bacterium]